MSKFSSAVILLGLYSLAGSLGHGLNDATKMDLKGAPISITKFAVTTQTPDQSGSTGSGQGSICRKLVLVVGKRLMKVFNGCYAEMKVKYPDSEDFTKHFQCVIMCSMRKVSMIDENYNLSNATYESFVKTHIPEQYQTFSIETAQICVTQYSALINGHEDPLCTVHGDFVKCMQSLWAQIC